MRLKQANDILIIFVLQCALLAFFVAQIPLHRMYGFADSGEYQRIALFILGKSGLAGGYAQFFPPGLSAAVAVLYLATNNIDVASMIANFLFSIGALFVFLRLSKSIRLTVLLMFIPYWLIISFSTLADASFIFLEIAVLALLMDKRYSLSLLVAAVSTMFRYDGLLVIGAVFLVLLCGGDFRKKFLFSPLLAAALILGWGQLAFGDPLVSFKAHAGEALNMAYLISSANTQVSLGFVGLAKVGYVILAILISLLTIVVAWRKFGQCHPFFVLATVFTLADTLLFPILIFPDYARLYLSIAPITLLVFRDLLQKRFLLILIVLAPLGVFVAYVFWTVTFSVPFL